MALADQEAMDRIGGKRLVERPHVDAKEVKLDSDDDITPIELWVEQEIEGPLDADGEPTKALTHWLVSPVGQSHVDLSGVRAGQ